jgi:hypothetical protein
MGATEKRCIGGGFDRRLWLLCGSIRDCVGPVQARRSPLNTSFAAGLTQVCNEGGLGVRGGLALGRVDGRLVILTWMRSVGRRLGAIALLAMLVRAIVPAGYMLAEAETPNGRYLVVQMCDDHRVAPQVIDLDTGKVVEASDPLNKSGGKAGDAPCVFAAAAQMTAPQTIAEPVVFQQRVAAVFIPAASVTPGRGIAAPPPPATGPPVL